MNKIVVSFAQFRPEKRQDLQIIAFGYALKHGMIPEDTKLVVIGSWRGDQDFKLKNQLEKLALDEHINSDTYKKVEFKVDLPFDQVIDEMAQAKIGIHTMWNEHFGIGVVEMMAAGLVVIGKTSSLTPNIFNFNWAV